MIVQNGDRVLDLPLARSSRNGPVACRVIHHPDEREPAATRGIDRHPLFERRRAPAVRANSVTRPETRSLSARSRTRSSYDTPRRHASLSENAAHSG
jgi:hypothetical protein